MKPDLRFPRGAARRALLPWMLLVAAVPPVAAGDAATARAAIDAIRAKHTGKGTIAVLARELDGPEWIARDADTPLKPASVMKLFTSAAALDRFGPAFRFRTRLFVRDGDLLVVGGGDPALGDERLAERLGRDHLWEFDIIAEALRAAGATRLERIVLDDHVFDHEYRHGDWDPGQHHEWYQAPVGGLNLNDNCVDARAVVAGKKVTLALKPVLPATFIDNALGVAKENTAASHRNVDEDIFRYTGGLPESATLRPIAFGNPTTVFGYALRAALEARGISVRGDIVRRDVPERELAQWQAVHTFETPLADVLWRTNTHSQNLFAEALRKALAAFRPDGTPSGQPGGWTAGRTINEQVLADLGVDLTGAALRDGCGLSHDNRVTPRQIVSLLAAMSRHRHRALFLDSLARPGEVGSMRTRYNDPAVIGKLRGKTGSISGVRTLAGIIERDDNRTIVFAVMINGDAPSTAITEISAALAR